MKGLCEWPQTLDPWFSIEVFAILDTKTMADIFPDPAWLKIYFTLKFGLFFVLSANILAVLDPRTLSIGSKIPKSAINFAVIFYTLKLFKLGNPYKTLLALKPLFDAKEANINAEFYNTHLIWFGNKIVFDILNILKCFAPIKMVHFMAFFLNPSYFTYASFHCIFSNIRS